MVQARLKDIICVPMCHSVNQMTKYKGYPNFDPFRRYFIKNYWERPSIQLIMTCDIKPLEQFLAQIVIVDIGSEGKIWKSVQNSLLTAPFTGKMNINHLGTWIIPFSWKTADIFRPFSSPWEECFKNMVHTCVFIKITKIYNIFGKNARNKCFRSKYQRYLANVSQKLAFPTPKH